MLGNMNEYDLGRGLEKRKHIDMFSTILDMFLLAMTLAGQISINVNKYNSFFLEQQFPPIQIVSFSFFENLSSWALPYICI